MSRQQRIGALAGREFVVPGGGNHSRIISRQGWRREKDLESCLSGRFSKALTQQRITSHPSGNEDRPDAARVCRCVRPLHEISDDGILEAGGQVERLLRAVRERFLGRGAAGGLAPNATLFGLCLEGRAANAVQHCSLQTAEAKVQGIAFHSNASEIDRVGVAGARQSVKDRATRVAQRQKLSYLVEGFAGSVISRLAEASVRESRQEAARPLQNPKPKSRLPPTYCLLSLTFASARREMTPLAKPSTR